MKWYTKNVLLLNADYSPISIISWKRAIRLLMKEKAKAIEYFDDNIHQSIQAPSIIVLTNYVSRLHKIRIGITRKNVSIRDNHICAYCGKKLGKHSTTIDHIVPKCKGGIHDWKNVITSCKHCNTIKNDKLVGEHVEISDGNGGKKRIQIKLLFEPKFPDLNMILYGNIIKKEEYSSWSKFFTGKFDT
jgi:5-methylcytosine-specific restriction endonuclease McrA